MVRAHEGGTCVTSGIVMPKHIACEVREWTPASDVDGEAVFEEPCRSSSVRNHRAERREMRLRERKKEGYVGLNLLRKSQCGHHDGTSGGVETHDAAMARAWGRPTIQASDD